MLLEDDAAQHSSCYFLASAENATAKQVCTMVNEGRGVICAPISESRARLLGLYRMATQGLPQSPDFYVSIEARQGVTTGISAEDRATTLQTFVRSSNAKRDLVAPGHIFPLRAKEGGVLVRSAPAEAAVDLLALANCAPVAALCQCLDEKGHLASNAHLKAIHDRLQIPVIKISEIIRHRLVHERIIEKIAESSLPVRGAGTFRAFCFRSKIDGAEHLALVRGNPSTGDGAKPTLIRVQAESPLGDLLGIDGGKSRERIHTALGRIGAEDSGIFVYIRHPHRSVLKPSNKEAPKSSEEGSAPMLLREFGIGAQILRELGAKKVRLLSNSSREIPGVNAFQIEIVERVSF